MEAAAEFALTDRGPFDRIVRPAKPIIVRAILLSLLAWLPLAILALISHASGTEPRVSFFNDLGVHVRFLIVIPLLILMEIPIGQRTRTVANTFITSDLVRPEDRAKFHEIAARTSRRAGSWLVEAVFVVVAVVSVSVMVRGLLRDGVVFWFEYSDGTAEHLSVAGWWYVTVAPVVGFLFLRWLWRYATWCWFLRKVSRLDLHLAATHADRAGGLGFVTLGQNSFALLPLASSCVVAAAIGTDILQAGAKLVLYKNPLIAFVIASIVVGMIPFPIFLSSLARTKRAALVEYGKLSSHYSQAFEAKWMNDAPKSDELLGSGDFQSLADLGGAFERLDSMRTTPLDKRTLIAFALAAILPMLPLALTVMPLKEIVKVLMKALV